MATQVSLPNLISLGRLLFVPVIVWLILSAQHQFAFWAFVICGLSDGVDGYIARRYKLETALGAYLDPLADKALMISVYIALGWVHGLPIWLVLLVVSRDFLIVGGVVLAWMLDHPISMRPLFVSKLNTVFQVGLAAWVLAVAAYHWQGDGMTTALVVAVAALTAGSAGAYVVAWLRHMTASGDSK